MNPIHISLRKEDTAGEEGNLGGSDSDFQFKMQKLNKKLFNE